MRLGRDIFMKKKDQKAGVWINAKSTTPPLPVSFSGMHITNSATPINAKSTRIDLIQKLQDILQLPHSRVNDAYALFNIIDSTPAERISETLQEYAGRHLQGDRFVGLYNAWPVLFTLEWKSFENLYRFVQNSANCAFSFMQITAQDNSKHKLFMKMVPLRKVMDATIDNPIIDNVNGQIIQNLCRHRTVGSVIRPHVMMYISSFNALVEKGVDRKVRQWMIKSIADVDSQLCPFNDNFNPKAFLPEACMCSVFEAIDGEPLDRVLQKGETAIYKVLRRLPKFADAMRLLGTEYGMLHNDLHSGNVFVDNPTGNLILIDYGRITFSEEAIGPEKIVDLLRNEKYRNFWYNNDSYMHMTSKNSQCLKYSHTDKLYFTHIFDIITLYANMEYTIKEVMQHEQKSWRWYDIFCNIKATSDREDSTITIPASLDGIKARFIYAMDVIDKASNIPDKVRDGMKLVGEGLFFLSCILLYVHHHVMPSNAQTKANKNDITLFLDDLVNARVFYYYFQWYSIESLSPLDIYEMLIESFKDDQTDENVIAYLPTMQKLMNDRIGKGGKKKRGGMNQNEDMIKMRDNMNVDEDVFFDAMLKNESRKIPFNALAPKKSSENVATDRPIDAVVQTGTLISAHAGGKRATKSTPKK